MEINKKGALFVIKVNGKKYEIDSVNLLEFIRSEKFDENKIAVELNGDIVKRGNYDQYILSDGDKIEIVCFVGGG
ncbi:sulfur carrier protein ThiS [Peptostreptococcus russellii]|uniref:sulfur carrier protein ThiS n=1 Tax=Peptostreptococcus russellii TaxID=215200 RepID=UPI001FA90489|nr:sulfur carrier protein ThiS [Peptostreptococcus russellii]